MRRFPRSTIILMTVILIGVGLAIESARNIQVKYAGASTTAVWDTFPGFFTFGFALMFVAAVTVWAILFALRRTGMHRLSNVQTWQDHE
jgi:ABC-type proline/glycine betaine transport system permease subunit